jgi:NTE family protein
MRSLTKNHYDLCCIAFLSRDSAFKYYQEFAPMNLPFFGNKKLDKKDKKLALVLSGGGTLGAFQCGCIDTLATNNLLPDLIVGTSVGAINGAYLAFFPSRDAGKSLFNVWIRCMQESEANRSRLEVIRNLLWHRDRLYDSDWLAQLVVNTVGRKARVEESKIPLTIVATNVITGEPYRIREGDLDTALLASSAIPGVLPPVEFNGCTLVDGGVVADLDIESAIMQHATDIIAINVEGAVSHNYPRRFMGIFAKAIAISLRKQVELYYRLGNSKANILLIQVILPVNPHFTDFRFTGPLYQLGKQYMADIANTYIDFKSRSVRPAILELRSEYLPPYVIPRASKKRTFAAALPKLSTII